MIYVDVVLRDMEEGGHSSTHLRHCNITTVLSRTQVLELMSMCETCRPALHPGWHAIRPVIIQYTDPLETHLFYHTLEDRVPIRIDNGIPDVIR